jgi:hypothetical protein
MTARGVNQVHAGQAADFDFNERSRNVIDTFGGYRNKAAPLNAIVA